MTSLLLALFLYTCRVAFSSTAGLRSVWVPVQYLGSFNESSLVYLNSIGVTRIYLDVWNNGQVYFQSQTMSDFLPDGSGFNRDILSEYIPLAHKYGIKVYAWFEYGFMSCYSSVSCNSFSRKADSIGWIIGEYDNFYWMNPNSNDVQTFLFNLTIDAAVNYPDLDGIQWDDHFACPSAFSECYSTNIITDASENFFHSIRAYSQIQLSLSPTTLSYAYNTFLVDWITIMNKGYFDEVIPQIYRSSVSSFEQELDYELQQAGSAIKALYIAGVEVDTGSNNGAPLSWSTVEGMINYAEAKGVGVCLWYCKGPLTYYPIQFSSLWG